jgi:quercetin dioxygenase-like cupin family protein
MAATRTATAVQDRSEAEQVLAAEGCSSPRAWENAPGDTYERHHHPYHEVLFCLDGSITFRLDHGELELFAGDRLDLEAGTAHAATVGPSGCACIEAAR